MSGSRGSQSAGPDQVRLLEARSHLPSRCETLPNKRLQPTGRRHHAPDVTRTAPPPPAAEAKHVILEDIVLKSDILCVLIIALLSAGNTAALDYSYWQQETAYQPLEVTLESEHREYSDGEWAIFTLVLKNVSEDTIRVPEELHGWILPVTAKPDGSFVEYDCLPPTYDCDPGAYESTFLLGPCETMGYGFQRLMSTADGGPGTYAWKYTLFLEECGDLSHTYDVVVNSSMIEVIVSE